MAVYVAKEPPEGPTLPVWLQNWPWPVIYPTQTTTETGGTDTETDTGTDTGTDIGPDDTDDPETGPDTGGETGTESGQDENNFQINLHFDVAGTTKAPKEGTEEEAGDSAHVFCSVFRITGKKIADYEGEPVDLFVYICPGEGQGVQSNPHLYKPVRVWDKTHNHWLDLSTEYRDRHTGKLLGAVMWVRGLMVLDKKGHIGYYDKDGLPRTCAGEYFEIDMNITSLAGERRKDGVWVPTPGGPGTIVTFEAQIKTPDGTLVRIDITRMVKGG